MATVAKPCPDCDVPFTYNLRCQACRVRLLAAQRCRDRRRRMQADLARQWQHRIVRSIAGGCDCPSPAKCKWGAKTPREA